MLYCFEDLSEISSDWVDGVLPAVSDMYKERLLSRKLPKDRTNSAIGYLLLCYALRNEYGITDKPVFSYGEKGKPKLEKYPKLHFGISHCDGCVSCLLSEEEVGLDVQNIRPVSDTVIKRVCNSYEKKRIFESDEKYAEFAAVWSVKESVAKLLGCGISTDLKKLTSPENIRLYQIETARRNDCFITVSRYADNNGKNS